MSMDVSVVIPTYRRPNDLSVCLDSLAKQSVPPLEIIVVGYGTDTASEALIRQREREFEDDGVRLRYVRSNRNSSGASRNMGNRWSQGEIVIFVDDDVILDADYVREIVRVYETEPTVLGVQGHDVTDERRDVSNFYLRLFFLYHGEHGGGRVLPSLNVTYPLTLDKIMPCEWFAGHTSSFRRHVLGEFQYDERIVRRGSREDIDLSYRIFKRYPGSLLVTPSARLVHNKSMQGRSSERELLYMREVYRLYLFFKLFDTTPGNVLIYLWSRLGFLGMTVVRAVVKRQPDCLVKARNIVGAYYLCLCHMWELRRGDLDFFNKGLLQAGN